MFIDFHFNLLTTIVLGAITLSLLVQLVFYWGLFSRLAFHKKKVKPEFEQKWPPVSVVISARNAVLELEKNLPYILYQDYPDYEVVVVNDSSDDGTEELLIDLARLEPKLNVVHIRQNLNFFQGKKFPLSLGIKSAKNEILLLTDADCHPTSNQWIKSMVQNYTPDIEIVIGYGAHEKKRGLLGFLQQFDTLQIAMLYLSKALARRPYMAVGRNLSYRKSVFMNNKGFIAHYNIPSGDDDLFIQQAANKKNTAVEISKESITFSDAKPTLSSWIRQKRRHLSTGKYYRAGIQFQLGLYAFTQLSFYATMTWLFFLPIHWLFPVAFFTFRYINQLVVFGKSAAKLNEKFLFVFTPLAELFFIIFNPVLLVLNVLTKPSKWM